MSTVYKKLYNYKTIRNAAEEVRKDSQQEKRSHQRLEVDDKMWKLDGDRKKLLPLQRVEDLKYISITEFQKTDLLEQREKNDKSGNES